MKAPIVVAVGTTAITLLLLLPHSQQAGSRALRALKLSRLQQVQNLNIYSLDRCNPYELRGTMRLNASDWAVNTWLPFDQSCQPINWMQEISSHIEQHTSHSFKSRAAYKRSQVNLGVMNQTQDLSFLQNKTIALFGDCQFRFIPRSVREWNLNFRYQAIDRHQVEDFCTLLNQTWRLIKMEDPATPTIPQHFWLEDLANPGHDYSNSAGHGRPTVCHISSLNFTILSIYHYSLATAKELKYAGFTDDFHYQPPAMTFDRFEYVVLPLLKNLGRELDLLQFSSYAWEHFLRWTEWRRLGVYPEEVNRKDVTLYGQRLKMILPEIVKKLPSHTPLLWRMPHLIFNNKGTVVARTGWAVHSIAQGVIEDLSGRSWSLYADEKQASDAALSANKNALLHGRLRAGGLGQLVPGYEHWYLDAVHFGFFQDYVGSNYLINELYRAVKVRENSFTSHKA